MRVAVRRALADLAPHAPVAAAVSGGADSLALAAALAHERPGAAALVVDHGLQPGSAEVAARAAEQCAGLGLRAQVLTAQVAEGRRRPDADDLPRGGDGGPEARARTARYAALRSGVPATPSSCSGTRRTTRPRRCCWAWPAAPARGAWPAWRRCAAATDDPLLDLPRELVRAACRQAGLTAWEDPHNGDPAYARVRVRTDLLPALEQALGPGVAAALARSARHLREDADALDALTPVTDDVAQLAALPAALRSRALAGLAERACGRAVTAAHVEALRALVEDWSGQGPVALPGGVRVRREAGRLLAGPPG